MPTTLQHSTYLDLTAYRSVANPATATVENVYGVTSESYAGTSGFGLKIAVVLPRANEPTFLSGNWAERQAELAKGDKAVFEKYGARPADYQAAVDLIKGFGIPVLDSTNSSYISSPESRTIWV